MKGFAAALDVKHDRGHAVLFAFQPEWRGQPTGTFRTVFNAVLMTGESGAQAKGATGFWTPPAIPEIPPDPNAGRRARIRLIGDRCATGSMRGATKLFERGEGISIGPAIEVLWEPPRLARPEGFAVPLQKETGESSRNAELFAPGRLSDGSVQVIRPIRIQGV